MGETLQPLVPIDGYPPLFWDFTRAACWYVPIALTYRLRARFGCWLRTRHAPRPGHRSYLGDRGPWWTTCDCGYFGVADRTSSTERES